MCVRVLTTNSNAEEEEAPLSLMSGLAELFWSDTDDEEFIEFFILNDIKSLDDLTCCLCFVHQTNFLDVVIIY